MNFRLLGHVGLGSRLFRCFVHYLSQSLTGSSRSVGLRIEGRPAEESVSGQTGSGLDGPTAVVVRVLPVGYPPLPGMGKGRISEIRYPGGSEYLRVVVRYVKVVGPSYAKTFATRYGPPSGVQIRCPDLLTSYVVPVPKMICFFEAAFKWSLLSFAPLHQKRSTTFQCMPIPALS